MYALFLSDVLQRHTIVEISKEFNDFGVCTLRLGYHAHIWGSELVLLQDCSTPKKNRYSDSHIMKTVDPISHSVNAHNSCFVTFTKVWNLVVWKITCFERLSL